MGPLGKGDLLRYHCLRTPNISLSGFPRCMPDKYFEMYWIVLACNKEGMHLSIPSGLFCTRLLRCMVLPSLSLNRYRACKFGISMRSGCRDLGQTHGQGLAEQVI